MAQKDLGENEPKFQDLYRIGVVAKIKQVVRHPEDGVRVFVEGLYRAELESLQENEPFLLGEVLPVRTRAYRRTQRSEALIRFTQTLLSSTCKTTAASRRILSSVWCKRRIVGSLRTLSLPISCSIMNRNSAFWRSSPGQTLEQARGDLAA